MADSAPTEERRFGRPRGRITVSVIIVAWQAKPGLDHTLAALAEAADPSVEVLIMANGLTLNPDIDSLRQAGMSGAVITRANNDGPSPARNAGARIAQGETLLFLDDDAIPEAGWVAAFRMALADTDRVAVRGRVVADAHPVWTRLARAYDLGPEPRNAVINTEGNSAFRRAAFREVGGFAAVFGHEGTELSGRLIERFGVNSIGYTPHAVIRHDYTTGLRSYLRKRYRHGRILRTLPRTTVAHAASVRRRRTAWDLLVAPMRALGLAAELIGVLRGRP